jgi:hypothetical protein
LREENMTKGHDRSLAFWIECVAAVGFVVFGSAVVAVIGVI